MGRFLESRAQSTTGRHFHSLEAFGLSRDAVRDRLATYCEAVGV